MHIERIWRKWLLMPFAWKHVSMPGRTCLLDSTPLNSSEQETEVNARSHIHTLATTIGERHKALPDTLLRTRSYLTDTLQKYGYTVVEHPFEDGVNLIAELPATSKELIVVGAHFDTVPGSPGANDNGSGIAALLELARLLRDTQPGKRIRFVAFDNEEHVGQPATAMGSYAYAQLCRARQEQIVGMWALETLGYFCAEANSQKYPQPFDLFYPTVGNFVAFVGNDASRNWVRKSVSTFRQLRKFPAEGVAAPAKFADINRSDNWGFGQAGYPALMVTDTANFRYPHYHKGEDTKDKVHYRELARLIQVLSKTLSQVAA